MAKKGTVEIRPVVEVGGLPENKEPSFPVARERERKLKDRAVELG